MKIRALANGNVIEANDEAAKILIENKVYEAVADDEPLTSTLTTPVPTSVAPTHTPAKGRATKKKAR